MSNTTNKAKNNAPGTTTEKAAGDPADMQIANAINKNADAINRQANAANKQGGGATPETDAAQSEAARVASQQQTTTTTTSADASVPVNAVPTGDKA